MSAHLLGRIRTCAGFAIAAGILFSPGLHAQVGAPKYEADLTWPKPLPDRWVLGGLGGVCVDARDHVFILNRQDVAEGDLNAARLAPPIIEFDRPGRWSTPGATHPSSTRGCTPVTWTRTPTSGSPAARPGWCRSTRMTGALCCSR